MHVSIVLRAEKGYIIVGQDTDGSVTPYDLGMGGLVAKSKDFLGKRSLTRSDTAKEGRKQFVGLLTEDDQFVLPEGAQIVAKDTQVSTVEWTPAPVPMLGHVTSSYYSPPSSAASRSRSRWPWWGRWSASSSARIPALVMYCTMGLMFAFIIAQSLFLSKYMKDAE